MILACRAISHGAVFALPLPRHEGVSRGVKQVPQDADHLLQAVIIAADAADSADRSAHVPGRAGYQAQRVCARDGGRARASRRLLQNARYALTFPL